MTQNFRANVAFVALLLVGLLLTPALLSGQIEPIQWKVDRDVTVADKSQILELAERVGIKDPRAVSSDLIRMPLGCLALRVESQVSVTGNRRIWTEIHVGRTDSTYSTRYYCHDDHSSAASVGHWQVVESLARREEWRIRDGDWQLDVRLGPGVTYEMAERIILAIKRKTFVDRRKGVQETPFGSQLLVGGSASVYRSQTENEYEVGTGGSSGGLKLRLAVTGERVELISADPWIS